MDKKTYYIAVGAKEILEDKTITPFEFEIEATEDEVIRLQQLFEDASSEEEGQMLPSFSLWRSRTDEDMNGEFDDLNQSVYEMIYKLGKSETRKVIEQMGVLTHMKPE